jgi:hypothetical protein
MCCQGNHRMSRRPRSILIKVSRWRSVKDTYVNCRSKTRIEATKAKLEDGHVTWRRSKDSASMDTAKLFEEHADLHKRYSKVRKGSRRFLVNAKDTTH